MNSSIQLKPQVFTLVTLCRPEVAPTGAEFTSLCYHGAVCTAELQPWHLPAAQALLHLDTNKHVIYICILINNI